MIRSHVNRPFVYWTRLKLFTFTSNWAVHKQQTSHTLEYNYYTHASTHKVNNTNKNNIWNLYYNELNRCTDIVNSHSISWNNSESMANYTKNTLHYRTRVHWVICILDKICHFQQSNNKIHRISRSRPNHCDAQEMLNLQQNWHVLPVNHVRWRYSTFMLAMCSSLILFAVVQCQNKEISTWLHNLTLASGATEADILQVCHMII